MQAVAAEMNQAETAFLRPRPDGDWDLRWFTPTIEVDLCGHATLASAHVLWESERVAAGRPIRFHTRSGVLTCTSAGGRIEMDFPAEPATPVESPAEEAFALGAAPGVRRPEPDGHAGRPRLAPRTFASWPRTWDRWRRSRPAG